MCVHFRIRFEQNSFEYVTRQNRSILQKYSDLIFFLLVSYQNGMGGIESTVPNRLRDLKWNVSRFEIAIIILSKCWQNQHPKIYRLHFVHLINMAPARVWMIFRSKLEIFSKQWQWNSHPTCMFKTFSFANHVKTFITFLWKVWNFPVNRMSGSTKHTWDIQSDILFHHNSFITIT